MMILLVSVFAFVGVAGAQDVSESGVEIDDRLYEEEGDRVDVVLRFGDTGAASADVSDMKSEVERNKRAVESLANSKKGIRVENSLWLANAVVVSVDTDKVSYKELSSVSGVERLHANFKVSVSAGAAKTADSAGVSGSKVASPESSTRSLASPESNPQVSPDSFTYGLEQINAPDVWSEFGTQGQGARVAVLDTGIDIDHPDLELRNDDPGNSTYPGGWAEFDANGNQVVGSEPQDSDSHGTHVSGTVAGGDASGTAIGVAPEAELMHGLVLPGGFGNFAQIVGGMQWAVEEDADVISMSLGATGYDDAWAQPVRNAEGQGVLVIAAAGNSGEGSSGSPGNVYDSLSVGASDSNEDIAGFSSGESITEDVWNSPPSDWPEEFVVPDVSAPGAGVMSTVPGGNYENFDGTSMATPHVSGTAALMISAAGDDLSPDEIRSTLETTARKPDGWSEPDDERDTRYGFGIIDARNATVLVAVESGVVGTVYDSNGDPVEGVEVSVGGRSTTTNASGSYEVRAPEGSYTVTADGFGYESSSVSASVQEGNFTSLDFTLQDEIDHLNTQEQPETIEAGDSFEVKFDVANLDEYEANVDGDFSEEDGTLYVNGNEYDFGESVSFSDYEGELSVEVETDESSSTPTDLGLSHQFSGAGGTDQASTGPTEVVEEFVEVAVVDDADVYGDEVATAVEDNLPSYAADVVTSSDIDDINAYDIYVVQSVTDDAFVQDTLDSSVPALYLDQWASSSNGVQSLSAVTGDPGTVETDYNSAPPVYHEIEQSHPIIEYAEMEPGDVVDIHDEMWGDHAWFENTDFDVLASVGDQQEGLRGSALAVNEDTNIVLASSLGRTQYALNEHYTEAADRLLAGSMVYLVEGNTSSATVESSSVVIEDDGGTGESSVTVDAEEGMSIANVEVSIDTSVAEIVNVTPGADVDPSENAVNYNLIDQTNDSVRIEYANIGADDSSMSDFELAVVEFEAQTDDGDATVEVSVDGIFDGSQNEYSIVNTVSGRLGAGALFSEPLPGFNNPPTNTQEIDPNLYEDLNGDGDGTDPSQTVTLWTELVVNPDEFNGLTQDQSNALDWDGDGQLTPSDAVDLWTQQVLAQTDGR